MANSELRRMWNESVMAKFAVPSWRLRWETGKAGKPSC